MKNIELVIFDIDGTLVDTTELFIQAYEYTFQVHGLEKKSRQELREIISVSKTLMESYQTIAPLLDFEKLLETHHEFRAKNIHLAKPFPNTVFVLQTLREKGIKVAGFTNRVTLVPEILKEVKIDGLLDRVISAADAGFHKPHPAGINMLLEYFKVEPSKAIMVGDSEVDVLAGEAAGLQATVGVTTGFNPEQIKQANPTYLISDLKELLALIS